MTINRGKAPEEVCHEKRKLLKGKYSISAAIFKEEFKRAGDIRAVG